MITLLYRAHTVGPVCKRLAAAAPKSIQALKDDQIPPGTVVRWGSLYNGAVERSINSSEAVATAKNHSRTRRILEGLCPSTWFRERDIILPCVIRPVRHHAGKRFFVCQTWQQVQQALRQCRHWYASQLIHKSNEYRVFVCQGFVVAVSERFPAHPEDIAWNLARGGRLINVAYGDWKPPICEAAIEATSRLGLDWAAIDVALDTSGRPVIFEANTAPGLRNPYTIKQIAKTFTWIDKHPATPSKDSCLLHPALRSRLH